VPPTGTRFRRSPNILSYWSRGQLVFHNFATATTVRGTAPIIGLLDYFDRWRPLPSLLAQSSRPAGELRAAVRTLVRASMLHQSNRPLHLNESAMAQWGDWNPAAGFFHFSTKDAPYARNETEALASLRERARSRPVPAPAKRYPGARTVALPAVQPLDGFSDALLARRTWRRFGRAPLSANAFGSLMGLTFGRQQSIDLGVRGRAMLRTSPSAGACNPIEAYAVVTRVSGVPKGIYHYAPRQHRLALVRRSLPPTIERHLPGQWWYGGASVVVFLTAVFARTNWKYPSPRAYRTILLEAGHFCQTFCLVAAALGLAPFCSAALADTAIERDLGIDGVTESVLYACGVGTRPPGVESAPWPTRRRRRTRGV
jgi:SagB-type dehydrogenase family enzyme